MRASERPGGLVNISASWQLRCRVSRIRGAFPALALAAARTAGPVARPWRKPPPFSPAAAHPAARTGPAARSPCGHRLWPPSVERTRSRVSLGRSASSGGRAAAGDGGHRADTQTVAARPAFLRLGAACLPRLAGPGRCPCVRRTLSSCLPRGFRTCPSTRRTPRRAGVARDSRPPAGPFAVFSRTLRTLRCLRSRRPPAPLPASPISFNTFSSSEALAVCPGSVWRVTSSRPPSRRTEPSFLARRAGRPARAAPSELKVFKSRVFICVRVCRLLCFFLGFYLSFQKTGRRKTASLLACGHPRGGVRWALDRLWSSEGTSGLEACGARQTRVPAGCAPTPDRPAAASKAARSSVKWE